MKLAAARAAGRAAAASYVSARETELPKLLADGPSRVCVFFPLVATRRARVDGRSIPSRKLRERDSFGAVPHRRRWRR